MEPAGQKLPEVQVVLVDVLGQNDPAAQMVWEVEPVGQ
jgi:hypothetical protein